MYKQSFGQVAEQSKTYVPACLSKYNTLMAQAQSLKISNDICPSSSATKLVLLQQGTVLMAILFFIFVLRF
jgi:hypothetical protein